MRAEYPFATVMWDLRHLNHMLEGKAFLVFYPEFLGLFLPCQVFLLAEEKVECCVGCRKTSTAFKVAAFVGTNMGTCQASSRHKQVSLLSIEKGVLLVSGYDSSNHIADSVSEAQCMPVKKIMFPSKAAFEAEQDGSPPLISTKAS